MSLADEKAVVKALLSQIMVRLVLSGTVPAGNHGICIQSLSWTGYLLCTNIHVSTITTIPYRDVS